MTNQSEITYNFSENSLAKGRVLIIAVGGAGIPKNHENISDNLRDGLSMVPYLSDSANRIDWPKKTAPISPPMILPLLQKLFSTPKTTTTVS